jgi:hypothetical protein
MASKRTAKLNPEPLSERYSGNQSAAFWVRLNAADKKLGSGRLLFQMGCMLQSMEYEVLRAIQMAEDTQAQEGNNP